MTNYSHSKYTVLPTTYQLHSAIHKFYSRYSLLLNVPSTSKCYHVLISPQFPTPRAPDYSAVCRTMVATPDAGTSFYLFTRMISVILSKTFSR